MNRLQITPLLLALLVSPSAARGQPAPDASLEEPLAFALPVPEGWRTETIPFPLGFAPELPYRGLEELRFSPGMFVEGSPEFWSYSFVWWVASEDPTDTVSLDAHLESYFRGLAAAVAPSRGFDLDDAIFSTSLVSIGNGGFSGGAETPDAFVTGGQVRLNVRGSVVSCPGQQRKAVIFGLSPQEPTQAIWQLLDSVRTGFRCRSPVATSSLFELHSTLDVNLHQFLYHWSRTERPLEDWRLVEVPERDDLDQLTDDERRRWLEAVAFYRRELAPHDPLFGAGMVELRNFIAGTASTAYNGDAERVGAVLDSVRSIYLDHWWTGHDDANRAWIEELLPALSAHETTIAPRLAAAYAGSWPDSRIRVDISAYTNDVGAYCSDPPPHVMISSRNPGHAMPMALESLFHEASHVSSLIGPLITRLAREFGYHDLRPSPRLWHRFIFYTAGELTRQAYAVAGDRSYQHYGVDAGYYDRSPPEQIDALRHHWHRYLNGEIDRDRALEALVEELTAGGSDEARSR